ncbi:MAG: DEAD/DEAH box helicase family protein [Melioribacteraceae bacterium]|jgi:superfamily II DNA or RNA helicase|nr:DEAD/DEAH box helicase family protein [Melioribacteraceae bacterium]
MFQEALQEIKFQPGRILYTEDGALQTFEAVVPESFWGIWRLYKEKLKDQGISIKKTSGKWIIIKSEKVTQQELNIKDIKLNTSGLLNFQIDHTKILISDMIESGNALDASDTGAGKTYTALAIARYFNLPAMILVPKTAIPKWKKVAKIFGVKVFVSNYEQFKNGNTPFCQPFTIQKIKKKKNPDGLTYDEIPYEEVNFKWEFEKERIIIFDEAHRCKNRNTQNSRLLTSVLSATKHVLCLSATIADNPLQMYALGIALGLFKDERGFYSWCYKRGVSRSFFGLEFSGTKKDLAKVHNDIFPHHGHRITTSEVEGFPENLIISDAYEMGNSKQIQSVYDHMYYELEKLHSRKKEDKKEGQGQHLVERLRARQEIELLKIPAFVEMAEDAVEEGMSVAIFLNFEESVKALSERLKIDCIITGKVSAADREKNRMSFQKGKERIIILNTQAGGESIDLHDEFGNYPRLSLISPTYSAQTLKQVLGRLPRTGAKSKVIQKIVFAAGTVEEEVADRVTEKIKNISVINDGDLEEL